MPLRVQCSAGHLMMVPDHRAGTVLRCPNCGIDVQVPATPGAAVKDTGKPRISTPVLAGKDAKPGLASPNLSKPKPKLPTVPEPIKPTPPEPVSSAPTIVATTARDMSEFIEPPPVVELPVPPPLEMPPLPAAVDPRPEVVFTSPVIVTPKPLVSEPPLIIDQSTVETVELPPKKLPPKKEATGEPAPTPSAYARQRESERLKPEGTRRSEAAKSTEPLFEIKDEPPVAKPVFASAATVIDAEVLADPPLIASATPAYPAPLPEPTPAPPQYIVQGPQPTTSQRHTVWQLAAALSAAMFLSIGPSLWEFSDYLRSESGIAVARWAFLLLFLGVVQLGSIVLLLQVPDWSSVWIVTLQSLALAALYAAVLGLTVITGGNSSLVDVLHLDQQYNTGKAPPWCLCLAATYACLAFFAGRFSAKWRKVHRQVEAAERSAAAHA